MALKEKVIIKHRYVIRITKENVRYFLLGLIFSVLFALLPAMVFLSGNIVPGILFSIGLAKLYFFKTIDLVLGKEIIETEKGLFIRICGISLPLNRQRCRLEIENICYYTRRPRPQYALVLVRDDRFLIFSFFKNRVKLYMESQRLDIIKEMEQIAALFDIRYLPFDCHYNFGDETFDDREVITP